MHLSRREKGALAFGVLGGCQNQFPDTVCGGSLGAEMPLHQGAVSYTHLVDEDSLEKTEVENLQL